MYKKLQHFFKKPSPREQLLDAIRADNKTQLLVITNKI